MADVKKPASPALVSCATCMKEIPPSGAKHDETSDYVRYFCGLDCYEKWHKQALGQEAPEAKK